MGKKTVGAFIAALRKANGMTQKDLAERLHVSDKTISRWERDDGAPDLSAIPVLAEIFGISCDELLRGERRSQQEREELPEGTAVTARGEKQRQRLLRSTFSRYQTQTAVAMGLSAAGVVVALLCNLAFLKAVLGFLCGAILFIASAVCQAIFLNRAFFSVEDAGLDEKDLAAFRRKTMRRAERSAALTVGCIGFTLPLIFMDAYVGLNAKQLLLLGSSCAAVLLLLHAVVCHLLNASHISKGRWLLNEKEAAVYAHNHRLKRISAILLTALLVITLAIHLAATSIWGPWTIMKGVTFDDYDSFIAFMEQDIPQAQVSRENAAADDQAIAPADQAGMTDENAVRYDESGKVITEEEARHRTLEDKNGNVVCTYTAWNEDVISLRYSPQVGTVLPITVYTSEDLEKAQEKAAVRNVIFIAAYCVEAVVVLLWYFKKRWKWPQPPFPKETI